MATLNDILQNRNYLNAPSLNTSDKSKAGNQSLPQKIDYVASLSKKPTGTTGGGNQPIGGGGGGSIIQNAVGGGGGGGGGGDTRSPEDIYRDQVRGDIENGYNSYFGYLDELFNSLPGQANNQNQIVQNTTNQNISDLDATTNQSKSDLLTQRRKVDENQNKNLRDLSDNIINQSLAGSIYLGSRGAGDSSAANMYSYALNKQGNKQRGDIIAQSDSIRNDISDRESRVNNIYTQEKSRIMTDSQNKLLEVAQWLAQQQNAVKQAKASGQLDKSKDLAQLSSQLLNVAISRAQQIDADGRNRMAALESWAMSNSRNINELKSNLSQISTMNPNLPQAQQLVGTPTVDSAGNYVAPAGFGYGSGTTDELKNRNIFNNA